MWLFPSVQHWLFLRLKETCSVRIWWLLLTSPLENANCQQVTQWLKYFFFNGPGINMQIRRSEYTLF